MQLKLIVGRQQLSSQLDCASQMETFEMNRNTSILKLYQRKFEVLMYKQKHTTLVLTNQKHRLPDWWYSILNS